MPESWCAASKRHKCVWCPSLTMKHSGSHSYSLKVWGDVVSRLDHKPDNKPRSGALAQAIAREKEPPT